MAKQIITVGDGGIAGHALVDQKAKDGSVRQTKGDFDLTSENIARIQLDHITRGKLFKKEEDRILIMTKSQRKIELFRSKIPESFEQACADLKAFAKKNYITFQDDLGVEAT
jgi:hypothetical protein